MPFDLASAKPVSAGFDIASAKPADAPPAAAPPPVQAPDTGMLGTAKKYGMGMTPIPGAEAALNMGSGMLAAPVANVIGLADIPLHAMGLSNMSPERMKKTVQEGMTYEPRTDLGKDIAQYNPLALLGKGIDYVGSGAGNAIKRAAPGSNLANMTGDVVHEAIDQAPGLLGAKLGARSAAKLPEVQAGLDVQRGLEAPLDAIRKQSQDAGLITPPEGTSWFASIPGMSKVVKGISAANEPKVNQLVADEFGIPKGVALSAEELDKIRKENGKAYQDVVDAGLESGKKTLSAPTASPILDASGNPLLKQSSAPAKGAFQTTPEFTKTIKDQLADLESKLQSDPETFKALRPSARLLREQLKDVHDPATTMEKIKQLRRDAATDFKSDNPTQIARAFTSKAIAAGLEDMIESNLKSAGKTDLLKKFREARTTIAKTYDVESALDNTGNINARKLYLISQKKPLSGNLKTIADYAGAYPEGVQKVPVGQTAFGPWDFLMGLPNLAAKVAIPLAAKSGLLQKTTPTYRASAPGATLAPSIGMGSNPQRQE